MHKFCHREESGPFFGFIRSEQPEICFQFLVYPFCFSVSLRVIGCGEGDIILEEVGKFLCEGRGELWSSVGDYFGVETESGKNIGEEKLGHSLRINVFCAGAINYPLHKVMVYHDHD